MDATNKTTPIPGNVTILYKANINNTIINITIVWSKTLINHSLSISIHNSTVRIDLNPWPFWGKKGFKSLNINNHNLNLFWDLRSSKFSNKSSPEPTSNYHVTLVNNQEVILLLGDLKKKAYKYTKARPSLHEAKMVLKRENVYGKRCFSTRVRFDGWKKEHDIMVENSMLEGSEMWVSVDGVVMIHVRNLQWKFRGNETVVVDGRPVQVFWNVHDWFFGGAGIGQALFVFKPGAAEAAVAEMGVVVEGENEGSGGSWSSGEGEEVGEKDEFGGGAASEFCFILCALCIRGEIK